MKKKKIWIKIEKIFEIILIMVTFYFMSFINSPSITFLILLFLIIVLYKYTKKFKNNKNITIISMLFSFLFTIGNINPNYSLIGDIVIMIIEVLGWYLLLRRLFYLVEKNYTKINVTYKNSPISKVSFLFLSTFIGFLLFLPYLLKFYPGILSPDSYSQLSQVIGNASYNNHHPVLHTFIIKIFYDFGHLISGSSNIGVLFYSIFQMLTASFIFSWVCYTLYRNNINKYFILALWLFFFITPYNAIYSVTMWKDILFSYIVLFMAVFLWDCYYNKKIWKRKDKIIFIVASFLVSLLRSNGFYAYIIFIILFFLLYRNEFKKIIVEIIVALVLIFTFKYPLLSLLNIKEPHFVESISIPLQQVAYVIRKNGNMSQEEIELIRKIANYEDIKYDNYNYHISDPVKNNIRANDKEHYLEKNKLKYLELWFNLGIKNIKMYKEAFVLQTKGYYYFNYGKYWVYLTTLRNDGSYGKIELERKNLLPDFISNFIDNNLENNDYIHYKYFYGSLAYSLYIVLISLFITITKKENALHYIIPLGIFITLLIATPVACEFRYFYAMYLVAPTTLLIALKRGEHNEKQ